MRYCGGVHCGLRRVYSGERLVLKLSMEIDEVYWLQKCVTTMNSACLVRLEIAHADDSLADIFCEFVPILSGIAIVDNLRFCAGAFCMHEVVVPPILHQG